jgi:hypothetical protein
MTDTDRAPSPIPAAPADVAGEPSNNPCRFDHGEHVSNPYKLAAASTAFLTEAARYFETRPTGGEDAAHWSNVYNAKNCREAAALIQSLSHDREVMREALERIKREDIVGHETQSGIGPSGRIAQAALARMKGGAK